MIVRKYTFDLFTVVSFKSKKKDGSTKDVGDEDSTNANGTKDNGSTGTKAFTSSTIFY